MALSLSKRQYFKYIIAIFLAGLVFGSVSLIYPFGRDQGIYAYAGKLLTEGKIDYKYAFDVKPPGVHFAFALSQLIFGTSMLSMRVFDILWQIVTALIVFFVTLRVTSSKRASLLSAFLYIFLYYRLDYWHTLQADGFLNLPLSASILLLMSRGERNAKAKIVLSGFFFGLVILFKYTMMIFLPAVILIMLFERNQALNLRIRNTVYYLTGFVTVVLIITGLYFFAGALNEFLDVQFVQTPLYAKIGYETESLGFIISNVLRLFLGSVYSPLILFSAVAFIYLLFKKQLNTGLILIYAWILCSIMALVIQWKFFYYHFLVIIPPIAAGASIFFIKLRGFFKETKQVILSGSIALVLAGYFLVSFKPYVENYNDLLSCASGRNSLEQMHIKKGFTSDSAFMIGKTFRAVNYIKSNTNENDFIYVWGFDPLIYYLSGRHCVSRFIYDFPLYWKGGEVKFREEFVYDLKENNPRLILISQRDPLYYISGYEGDSKLMLEQFPEFNQFIESKYSFRTQIDDFYFYELIDKSAWK